MGDDLLEKARRRISEHLNIDLNEPRQERRIEALTNLYKRYSEGADIKSLIYRDIIGCCDRLSEIYRAQHALLNELRISNESLVTLRVKLENIENQYKGEIENLEKQISISKGLMEICDRDYAEFGSIGTEERKKLRELEDRCWDNWLRALDVNRELRNTIIGFENRKSLLEISRLYIDYHILANSNVSRCFKRLKEDQKDNIRRYYEILSWYKLPAEKKVDFKIFLQKLIESSLANSMEVKNIFSEFAEAQRNQINVLISEVNEQYKRDQNDMTAIINHHKKQLLNQQVLFTNESEALVLYFKRRYLEKMDLLCSRFQMYHAEAGANNRGLKSEELQALKKLMSDEFDRKLNGLKMEYSRKTIPFMDNFWHMEQTTGNTYALDEEQLNEKLMDLKVSKNLGLKSLIDSFERRRQNLKASFDKKLSLIENVDKIGIAKFDAILKDLKDECEAICFSVINSNARFWTRINAEFNCVFKRYFVRLRHQYAPYIKSWMSECDSWMNEYLKTNLNQEILKSIGEVLEGISPEAEFYTRIAKYLLRFNEKTRLILVKRDNMELEQLMLLNTLPEPNLNFLEKLTLEKLNLRQSCYTNFLEDYNRFYREKFSAGHEI